MSQLLVFIVLLATIFTSHAEIYKWVDDQGRVHFGDKRPQAKLSEEVSLKINTYTSVSYDEVSFDSGQKVVIYTTPTCRFCHKAKQYFSRHNIAYTEHDITKDTNANKRFKAMGGRGVPVILVGKKRMNGFSEAGFKKIYQ